MRIIRFLILYVMVTILGLLALAFLGLNHFTVQLDVIAAQYPVSIAWVMLGAAFFGFVLTLLMLLPGRLAAALNIRALDRETRELERELEKQQMLRAHLLEQHELLLERHERMLVRHQVLVSDHSQIVNERDEARAQLAALRHARPAVVAANAHPSGAATALRLLPQADPVPAVRSVSPAAPEPSPHSAPTPATEPAPRPVTPGPWCGVAPVALPPLAPVAPVASIAPPPAALPPAPATVPVVSAPSAPAPLAVAPPPRPASPMAQKSPKPPRQARVVPALSAAATRLRAGMLDRWRSAGASFMRLRAAIVQAWRAAVAQVSVWGRTLREWVRRGWRWLQLRVAALRAR